MTCVAGSWPAGCGAHGKAGGPPSQPWRLRVRGRTGGATIREPLLMPRHVSIPGWAGFPGWQGPAVERRQAAAAHAAWPVGTVVPGVERAPGPVWVSCVRNVETLLWVRILGAGMRRRCGKPTVRGAEFPGRTGCPGSRCRAAERRQEGGAAGPGLLPDWPRITGPDAGC